MTGSAIGGKRRDIYVTASESGRVTAFDAVNGKTLWTRDVEAETERQLADFIGSN